jgi:hypothetical protein
VAERILADTGPVVALLKRNDAHHAECKRIVAGHKGPLLTCWPVITEAAWLLRDDLNAVKQLLNSIKSGLFQLMELDADAASWMAEFIERYSNLGAQVADAALMYLAEQNRIMTVFTLDRRDFSVYRTSTGKALRLIPGS